MILNFAIRGTDVVQIISYASRAFASCYALQAAIAALSANMGDVPYDVEIRASGAA